MFQVLRYVFALLIVAAFVATGAGLAGLAVNVFRLTAGL